jgi:transposase InsO family protein
VGDITPLPTRQGVCLAVVIDWRTRQTPGDSLSERMPEDLVRQALLNAWTNTPAGYLFHSDRGSQYAPATTSGARSRPWSSCKA